MEMCAQSVDLFDRRMISDGKKCRQQDFLLFFRYRTKHTGGFNGIVDWLVAIGCKNTQVLSLATYYDVQPTTIITLPPTTR